MINFIGWSILITGPINVHTPGSANYWIHHRLVLKIDKITEYLTNFEFIGDNFYVAFRILTGNNDGKVMSCALMQQ